MFSAFSRNNVMNLIHVPILVTNNRFENLVLKSKNCLKSIYIVIDYHILYNMGPVGVVGYHVSLTRPTDKVLSSILRLVIVFLFFFISLSFFFLVI